MPFLRFSRDKRGYEHTYLIHTSNKKGAQARILYWYRTPPGVKVGRPAFDADVRQALEAQYPSITFEWSKLMDVTPPPPDAEHWRDRRRQEKAARQARQAAERDDRRDEPAELADADPAPDALNVEAHDIAADRHAPDSPEPDTTMSAVAASPVPAAGGDPTDGGARPRKRRRRGGRRRRKTGPGDSAGPVATGTIGAAQPDADVETDADGGDESDDESPDVA